MVASRSISDGASTSRERPHERHDGYTRNDGADEHSAPWFPCSIWVVAPRQRLYLRPERSVRRTDPCTGRSPVVRQRLLDGYRDDEGGDTAMHRAPSPLGAALSVARPSDVREPDIERQEAVEQDALAPRHVQRLLQSPVLEQPEPAQRPENPPHEHRGRQPPARLRYCVVGDRAQRGERRRILPILRHRRQPPEDDADLAARKRATRCQGAYGAFTESGDVWTATKTLDVRLKVDKLVENDVTFTIELGNPVVTNGDFVFASTLTEEHEQEVTIGIADAIAFAPMAPRKW